MSHSNPEDRVDGITQFTCGVLAIAGCLGLGPAKCALVSTMLCSAFACLTLGVVADSQNSYTNQSRNTRENTERRNPGCCNFFKSSPVDNDDDSEVVAVQQPSRQQT